MKKRILSLVLSAAMVISMCTVTSARIIIHPGEPTVKITNYDEKNHTPQEVKANDVAAHYFESDKPVVLYSAHCPSYNDNKGSITLSLYKWAGSYEATLNTEPIATKTHVDFVDNSFISVRVEYEKATSGAYLATLSGATQQVGVWLTDLVNPQYNNKVYINGNETSGKAFGCKVQTRPEVDVSGVENGKRDAYAVHKGSSFDKKTSKITVGSWVVGPQTSGEMVAYADVDFGSTPPKGIILSLDPERVGDGDVGQVQVRADNPHDGEIVAEVYFEYDTIYEGAKNITANLNTQITGVHDLYFIFYGFNYLMHTWQFTKEPAGLSKWDQRLVDFEPVPKSDLEDYLSDTWSATDMMGRKLPGYETVGKYDPDRQVGIFYWTWHANAAYGRQGKVFNNEATLKNYLRKNPGGKESDIKNSYTWTNADGSTGSWGITNQHAVWHWNESIYGHYSGLDPWVMRKQMELISAAGVDALFFDCTNGIKTFTGGYMTLAGVLHEMQQDGIKTPGISFILPFSGANANTLDDLERLYQSMYKHGLYSDVWYYWDGKPVIMGYPDLLSVDTGYDDLNNLHSEIADFFTFRPAQPSYFLGQQIPNQWSWLEAYPQHGFNPLTNSKYDYEMVAVGTAQNANDSGLTAFNGDGIYGRSYTYKDKHSLLSEESKFYGYNFQEQWERAIELNPKMVFITGWNEWSAGHYDEWGGVKWAFPDQYRDEYSRDIEPTKGDFKDNYYYQMVANIRKFRGVRETPTASSEVTIKTSNPYTPFNNVYPTYYAFPGGTEPRDFYGLSRQNYYVNSSGRNDIVLTKVARDKTYIYFYVKTKGNLTSYTDPNWMQLFINIDRTYKTGWEGYDFAVNITPPTKKTSAVLSYTEDGWNWKDIENITYTYSKNQMMIRIPRKTLGVYGTSLDFEFKWIDNMQNPGDIMDVYNNGDTAPIGRFAYRYTETTRYDKTPEDEPVTVSDLKFNQHKHSVILAIGKDTAFAGGKLKTLDVSPEIINDKTMIPLRFFSEGFGAEVKWNDATRTATVKLDGKTVNITVGKDTMDANGEEKALESPAVIKNGRILVPMRDIAESLGKKVHWVDGGLIIAGENPETVHSYEWVQDMTEDHFGIR